MCLDDIFWITEHLVAKFDMVMQHHEPECHAGIKVCCCYVQGQGHSEGSYDQNMTLSTVFSELVILWHPNLVWWYIIISQSDLWKKLDYCFVSWSRSQQRVKMLMFVQIISSKAPDILFPNSVLWCITMSRSIMQKDWFTIFKVKVTARAHMIKIWQFLLYVLNFWSFCYQTWFDSTLSLARVSYGEIGVLCTRSRSQQHFTMSMNDCPDDLFWIAELFCVTKLGMVMHHYEPDCLSKRLVCHL